MLNLQSIYFGQRHANFDYKDYDIIRKVARLANKHHKQAENDCNGVGYVNNQCYYGGQINDYARRTYGQNIKSACIGNSEDTIFFKEMVKIEAKILTLLKYSISFRVEFQGDPRGQTVKLYYEGDFIEL